METNKSTTNRPNPSNKAMKPKTLISPNTARCSHVCSHTSLSNIISVSEHANEHNSRRRSLALSSSKFRNSILAIHFQEVRQLERLSYYTAAINHITLTDSNFYE
mmetsp:Transcript_1287/g.1846  ORF Transcript_1287/g.1846 Transcript_1287/m.1846 type:complete len:105 (-) Transcript_1287:2168-2482(-)